MQILIDGLLWLTAISVGLLAGVYFTFSTFVMKSLDAIDAPAGMLAMQSINRVIVKSLFLPIFFGSTIASIALAALTAIQTTTPGAIWVLTGSTLYVVGMFVVTIIGNVPLNNRLEATEAHGPEGPQMWALYLQKWTVWNHVRTLACAVSLVLFILAIGARV